MCRAVECKTCGKTTWAGCGEHIAQVMKDVPRAQQCAGHERVGPPVSLWAKLLRR